MKTLRWVGIFLLITISAQGQSMRIDSVIVSSTGKEVLLYGDFGNTTGSVTLDGSQLPILSWVDTTISIQVIQPAFGELRVASNGKFSEDRILEALDIGFGRGWGGGHNGSGFSGEYSGGSSDILHYCFEVVTAINSHHYLNSYDQNGTYGFSANSTQPSSSYSASGDGKYIPKSDLSFNRGIGYLNIYADSVPYSYSFSNNNTGGTGTGNLILPRAIVEFRIVDTIFSVVYSHMESVVEGDSEFAAFCGWYGNSGTVHSAGASIHYPFNTSKVDFQVVNSPKDLYTPYPNPASTSLHINAEGINILPQLYSSSGVKVQIIPQLIAGEFRFELESIASGVYELVCNTSKGLVCHQVLIYH